MPAPLLVAPIDAEGRGEGQGEVLPVSGLCHAACACVRCPIWWPVRPVYRGSRNSMATTMTAHHGPQEASSHACSPLCDTTPAPDRATTTIATPTVANDISRVGRH